MPSSICQTCQKKVYWHNRRGSSSPKTCECGGVMRRDGYVAKESLNKGKKYAVCVVCERRRLGCEPTETAVEREYWMRANVIYPKGSMMCAYHRSWIDTNAGGLKSLSGVADGEGEGE